MKKQTKKWLPVFAAAFLCVGLYIAPIYAEETETVETQPVTEQEPTTEPMDEAERIQDVQEPVETPAHAQTPSDEEEVTPVQTPQEPVLTVNENPDIKYPFWIIPLRQGTTGADQMKVSIYQPLSTVKEEVAQHYRDKGFDVVKEQIELIWSAADETTPGPSDGLWEYMDDDSRTFFDYIDAADRWEIEYWISRFGGGDAVKAQIRILFRPKYVISKIDEAGNPMEGIRFQVLNSKGDVVEEWESTKEKKTLYLMPSVYIPGYTGQGAYFVDLFDGLYTLTEVAAPSGFVRAEDVSIDLSDMVGYLEKETTDVVVLNEPTRVRVCKVDQDGNLLAGAKMQVLDAQGNVVYEFVSDNKGFIVTGQLEPGVTYTLHEVSAPTGYLPAEDVTFTVNETAAMLEVWMIDIKQPQPEPKPEPQPDPEKEEPVKEEKKEVVTAHRIQTGVADGSLVFMGMSFLSLMGIGWIVKMNH